MDFPILLKPLIERPRRCRVGRHHFHRCPQCGGGMVLRGPARTPTCRDCRHLTHTLKRSRTS
jgi:hypothetical protein